MSRPGGVSIRVDEHHVNSYTEFDGLTKGKMWLRSVIGVATRLQIRTRRVFAGKGERAGLLKPARTDDDFRLCSNADVQCLRL